MALKTLASQLGVPGNANVPARCHTKSASSNPAHLGAAGSRKLGFPSLGALFCRQLLQVDVCHEVDHCVDDRYVFSPTGVAIPVIVLMRESVPDYVVDSGHVRDVRAKLGNER